MVKKRHLRSVNRDARDVEGLRENQRQDLDSDLQRLGGEERRRAEFGIVADGDIVGGKRAAEERKAEIAEFNFAAECSRSFFFNGGAELIDGNQKRRDEN